MRCAAALLAWFPLALFAEDPAPPAPPASAPRFKPSGAFKLLPAKHALNVTLDTDLPAQVIVQVYLKRQQFSPTGSPESRLVDSQRFVLDGKPPAQLEMGLNNLLPPAAYEVEVVFDIQGQYPPVQQKLAGVGNLRASFPLSVGTPEEIALEHEWGESRVVGAMRRLDEVTAKLKAGSCAWNEQGRRLGWLAERLGKVGASSPVPEIYFPQSEEALKKICDQLQELGLQANAEAPKPDPSDGFQRLGEARAAVDQVYAAELTQRVLGNMNHWMRFVHQEYWLNKIHKRLGKEQWGTFKAEQRKQLDAMEANYTSYTGKVDPVRVGIAKHFPALVPDCAALLRKLQDAYDAELAEGLESPGPRTAQVNRQIQALLAHVQSGPRRR